MTSFNSFGDYAFWHIVTSMGMMDCVLSNNNNNAIGFDATRSMMVMFNRITQESNDLYYLWSHDRRYTAASLSRILFEMLCYFKYATFNLNRSEWRLCAYWYSQYRPYINLVSTNMLSELVDETKLIKSNQTLTADGALFFNDMRENYKKSFVARGVDIHNKGLRFCILSKGDKLIEQPIDRHVWYDENLKFGRYGNFKDLVANQLNMLDEYNTVYKPICDYVHSEPVTNEFICRNDDVGINPSLGVFKVDWLVSLCNSLLNTIFTVDFYHLGFHGGTHFIVRKLCEDLHIWNKLDQHFVTKAWFNVI